MSDREIMKLLIDYNLYLKECVSNSVEPDKNTIRDYLKGSHWHEPIDVTFNKSNKKDNCIQCEEGNRTIGFCPRCDTDAYNM